MFAQVNVYHQQQPLDLVVAHLAILVLIGPFQVATDPGVKRQGIKMTRLKDVKTQNAFVLSLTQLAAVACN